MYYSLSAKNYLINNNLFDIDELPLMIIPIIRGDKIVDAVYTTMFSEAAATFYEKPTSSSPYDKNLSNIFEKHVHLCKFSKIFDIIEVDELKNIKNLIFRHSGKIKIFVNENESYTREVYDFFGSLSFFDFLLELISSPDLESHRYFYDIKTSYPTYSSLIGSLFDEIDQIIIGVSWYINQQLCSAEKHNWIIAWFVLFCDNLIRNFPEKKMKILDIKNKIIIQKVIT